MQSLSRSLPLLTGQCQDSSLTFNWVLHSDWNAICSQCSFQARFSCSNTNYTVLCNDSVHCPLIQYPLLLPIPVNVTGSCWSFCLPLQHLRQGLCVFIPHLSQVMQNLARLSIHWVQHMGSGLSKLLKYPVAHIISWRIPLPLNAPCQAWKTGRVSPCSSYSPVQWTTKSYTQTALLQQVLVCLSGLSVSTDQDFTSAIQVLPLTVRLKQQTYANQLKLYTMHSRYSLRAQLCWNPQRREGGREGGREEGREGGREEC